MAGNTGITVFSVSTFIGNISNAGTISGRTGISIGAAVTFAGGAIINSGTISGTTSAIDVTAATSPVTINQTAGLISGAIKLSTNADVLNVTGGSINGNIVGEGTADTVNFSPAMGTTFTYGALYGFTGVETVNVTSGTVVLNGTNSALTPIAVNGGTLAGTGTLTSVAVNSGGTLAPGVPGAVGTLTVTGGLALNAGSTYADYINGATASKTNASGGATIAGTAVAGVVAGSTVVVGTRYTLLTATGGVTGVFSDPTFTYAGVIGRLSYDLDDVYLTFASAYTPIDLRGAGLTGNQRNVANAIYNATIVPGSGSGALYNALLNVAPGSGASVLNGLSGEGIIAAQNAANRSVSEFTSSIFDQTTLYGGGASANSVTLTSPQAGFMALAPSGTTQSGVAPIRELADLPSPGAAAPLAFAPIRTWRAWATGFGGTEYIQGNAGVGSASQNNSIYGGTLGVDYQLTPNYLAGIAISGSDGAFSVGGRATSGSTTGGHIAFYDLATLGAFYGASSNSVSFFTNKTTRIVAGFGGLAGETDRGTFDSHEFRTRLEFGRHFGSPELTAYGLGGLGGIVTPFVALEIAELRSNGFSETNLAGPTVLGLNVQGQTTASVPSFVGARYQGKTVLGEGMVLTPSLQVAYVHEFAPQRTQIGGLINLPGATFLVNGAQPASNAAQVKAGAELAIGPQSTLFATFDGEYSGQAQFYGGKGGFKYVW